MSLERALQREEDALEREYEEGGMSNADYQRALRELHRDARAEAQQRAEEAYEESLGGYFGGGWR